MSDNDIQVEIVPLGSLKQDPRNANQGTQRGRDMLVTSIQERGTARSIFITKDGVIKAGNKTQESALAAGVEEIILVHNPGGKRLVGVVRDDLEHDDPEADMLGVEDNRVAEVGLSWQSGVLDSLFNTEMAKLWTPQELKTLDVAWVDEESRLNTSNDWGGFAGASSPRITSAAHVLQDAEEEGWDTGDEDMAAGDSATKPRKPPPTREERQYRFEFLLPFGDAIVVQQVLKEWEALGKMKNDWLMEMAGRYMRGLQK